VESNPGDDPPNLTVLESVRCLECGAFYAKPSDGGTVRQNPGCPECGYVGWMAAAARPFSEVWRLRHSGGGPLPHHSG
jgi:ribosomal protein S27AE